MDIASLNQLLDQRVANLNQLLDQHEVTIKNNTDRIKTHEYRLNNVELNITSLRTDLEAGKEILEKKIQRVNDCLPLEMKMNDALGAFMDCKLSLVGLLGCSNKEATYQKHWKKHQDRCVKVQKPK